LIPQGVAQMTEGSAQDSIAPRPRVAAVVVTYHPRFDRLRRQFDALAAQTDGIVVVDNSGDPAIAEAIASICRRYGATLLPQPTNRGLAAGFNAGLRAIGLAGFTHGLLMDQDSLPQERMVERLMQTLLAENVAGDVAAIGPGYFDRRGVVPASFAKVGFPGNRASAPREAGGAVYDTDYLISSGCLLPLAALGRVGDMDESLFIDNLDMEWCFRARARGLRLLGNGDALLEHELGDDRIRLPFGRIAIVHPPYRLYYIMRNRVLLYWMPHVPWRWKAQDVLRLPAKIAIFSLLAGPRRANTRHMLLGIWHGLLRRTGPLGREPAAARGGGRTLVKPGSSA
jgi:rhamnosyltransferase